ncbi:hypothetical protein RDI58_006902 [Solanum bulbocastanum]|uniref:Uncharacterized protein n=1 Tax=Solanum bulbocastanum TaxID=147425 RepID=A0AAN8YH84_SOLBU
MSSSSAESKMVLAKTVLSTVGSVAATTMLVRSIIHDYIPMNSMNISSLESETCSPSSRIS